MEAIEETEGIAMEEMDARMKIDENAMQSDWKRRNCDVMRVTSTDGSDG